MLEYGKYKKARNASWQCILDYKINKLPIMVTDIINQSKNIRLFKNSDVNFLEKEISGKTIFHNDVFEIIYRDTEPSFRCRFTIAHELGHIFLGHLMTNTPQYRTFKIQNDTESQANVFARDLLSPACVLHELNALSAAEISSLCNISYEAATYRADRMKELEKRNAWYLHPLEKEVKEQFNNFIIDNRKSRPVERTQDG